MVKATEQELKELFDQFDSDKNGFMNASELVSLLRLFDCTEEEVEEITQVCGIIRYHILNNLIKLEKRALYRLGPTPATKHRMK